MTALLPSLIYRHTHVDSVTGNYVPSVGYRMYSFEAGTNTPADTLDESGATNTNPVILDANGECHIRLNDISYKFVLTDDTGEPDIGPTGEGVVQDGFPVDNVMSDFAAAKVLIDALGGALDPSEADPQPLGSATAGTTGEYSDGGHVHPAHFPAAGIVGYNNASGSEMISNIADQTFASSTGNWSGTGWTIGSNVATHTAGANNYTLANGALTGAPVAGHTYKITVDIVTTTIGTIGISFGGTTVAANGNVSGTQTAFSVVCVAANTNALMFVPSAAWAGTIDNVSVKEITATTTDYTVKIIDGVLAVFA